jgi:hypothetical protein
MACGRLERAASAARRILAASAAVTCAGPARRRTNDRQAIAGQTAVAGERAGLQPGGVIFIRKARPFRLGARGARYAVAFPVVNDFTAPADTFAAIAARTGEL